MDVLIVKVGALGDVLRTTSVARRLRASGARVEWVTSRAAACLLERNPDLAEVHAIEDRPRLGRRFDLVLSLEEDADAAALAREACRGELIGVYEREGLRYTPSSSQFYDMSALNRDPDGSSTMADTLKRKNRLGYARIWLRVLGLPEPEDPKELRPVLILAEAERKAAARRFCLTGAKSKLTRAVGFNPGAGSRWRSKQLSPEAAASLADELSATGRPVFLLGGSEEAERNLRIAALARRPVVDAGTAGGLREFAALLSWLAAVVTTDTLAFHIASALGLPTIVLVGPTSAAELELFGPGAVVTPESCSCFYRPDCAVAPSCLDRLPAARVLEALTRCL